MIKGILSSRQDRISEARLSANLYNLEVWSHGTVYCLARSLSFIGHITAIHLVIFKAFWAMTNVNAERNSITQSARLNKSSAWRIRFNNQWFTMQRCKGGGIETELKFKHFLST